MQLKNSSPKSAFILLSFSTIIFGCGGVQQGPLTSTPVQTQSDEPLIVCGATTRCIPNFRSSGTATLENGPEISVQYANIDWPYNNGGISELFDLLEEYRLTKVVVDTQTELPGHGPEVDQKVDSLVNEIVSCGLEWNGSGCPSSQFALGADHVEIFSGIKGVENLAEYPADKDPIWKEIPPVTEFMLVSVLKPNTGLHGIVLMVKISRELLKGDLSKWNPQVKLSTVKIPQWKNPEYKLSRQDVVSYSNSPDARVRYILKTEN